MSKLPAPLREGFLTGNALKYLALLTMTIDHAGLLLFHNLTILRIIGRLAFPIFAYMIAEGCRYTRRRARYFGSVFLLGCLCQGVYFAVDGSLYLNILLTFSLSILLVYLVDWAKERRSLLAVSAVALGVGLTAFVCILLPKLLPGTDFQLDYGFFGVLLPVLVSLGRGRWSRLGLTALGLVLLSWDVGWLQWWSLLALLPLACYNGKRGKRNTKWLFYVYYPLHLVVLDGLSLLV